MANRVTVMAQKTQWILTALLLLLAIAMVGCNAAPKRWVDESGNSDQRQIALSQCRTFVKENFNPDEDFSDPALGSSVTEENLNRRVAYRNMFYECMRERGFHLEPAA